MMKFHSIALEIGIVDDGNGPEARFLFSRLVRDVRMTADEAEAYADRLRDAAKMVREAEETPNRGIDTGILRIEGQVP